MTIDAPVTTVCNAEIADQVAAAVATAPVAARLEVLDLHFHYLSATAAARAVAHLPGVEVDVAGSRQPDDDDDGGYRYTMVGE